MAHDYPWRACRADFTRARGSQGLWTATRRATGAALTARSAVVTRISVARRLTFMRLVCRPYLWLGLVRQLQCVGCGAQKC
jgi:hypothetical protein